VWSENNKEDIMKFFELPKDREVYLGSDVIDLVAKHCNIPLEEAENRIAEGGMIRISDFMVHKIIIGKSFGEVLPLELKAPDRRVKHSQYSSPGMVVAISEPNDFEKSKAGQRWKKMLANLETAP
jgi:hypothetical protein